MGNSGLNLCENQISRTAGSLCNEGMKINIREKIFHFFAGFSPADNSSGYLSKINEAEQGDTCCEGRSEETFNAALFYGRTSIIVQQKKGHKQVEWTCQIRTNLSGF